MPSAVGKDKRRLKCAVTVEKEEAGEPVLHALLAVAPVAEAVQFLAIVRLELD